MRVLLINPYAEGLESAREPLALGYLAGSLLEAGIDTSILDLGLCESWPDALVAKIADFRPDIMGITTYTPTFGASLNVARLAKQIHPQSKIVLGGYHASIWHDHIMRDLREVDFTIRGEGEVSLRLLCSALGKGDPLMGVPGLTWRTAKGRVKANPVFDSPLPVDSISLPARHLMQLSQYEGVRAGPGRQHELAPMVLSSRGCGHNCAFCSISTATSRVRYRSIPLVMEEVETLIRAYGANHIIFADPSFLTSRSRVMEFCAEMVDRRLRVQFHISARADDLIRNQDLLVRLAELGLGSVEIGVENINDSVLKRFDKGTSAEQNLKALALLRELGLRIFLDYIMLDPESTIDEVRNSILFLRNRELLSEPPFGSVFTKLEPLPGTRVYEGLRESLRIGHDHRGAPFYLFRNPQVALFHAKMTKYQIAVMRHLYREIKSLQEKDDLESRIRLRLLKELPLEYALSAVDLSDTDRLLAEHARLARGQVAR